MVRKMLTRLVAITLIAVGATAAVQSPALAVGGCANNNVTLNACVDFGSYGHGVVRADFYLDRPADASVHHYNVWFVIDGYWYGAASGTFGGTGRYCCWYKTYDNLPNTYNSARTVVDVWTNWGALHMSVSSPTINFWS